MVLKSRNWIRSLWSSQRVRFFQIYPNEELYQFRMNICAQKLVERNEKGVEFTLLIGLDLCLTNALCREGSIPSGKVGINESWMGLTKRNRVNSQTRHKWKKNHKKSKETFTVTSLITKTFTTQKCFKNQMHFKTEQVNKLTTKNCNLVDSQIFIKKK